MRKYALLLAAATFGLALAAVAEFDFKAIRAVGEKSKTKVTAEIEIQGIKVEQSYVTSEEVTEVKDGLVTSKSSMSEQKIVVNGQEQPAPPDRTNVSKSKLTGELVESDNTSEQPLDVQKRISRVTAVVPPEKPVGVGGSWSVTLPKDEKSGLVPGKLDYKVVAVEKVGKWDVVKVDYSFKETEGGTPLSAKGTMWLTTKKFDNVKADIVVENFEAPGVPMPLTVKLKIERID
jgi:hypothetical protein